MVTYSIANSLTISASHRRSRRADASPRYRRPDRNSHTLSVASPQMSCSRPSNDGVLIICTAKTTTLRDEFVTNQKQRRRRSRERGSVDCAFVATSHCRFEYYNHDEYYLFRQSNAAAAHTTRPATTASIIGLRWQIPRRQSGRVCHFTRVTQCQ